MPVRRGVRLELNLQIICNRHLIEFSVDFNVGLLSLKILKRILGLFYKETFSALDVLSSLCRALPSKIQIMLF